MTKLQDMHQAIWRKAWLSQEPLRIACPTESDAAQLRFALYNAVRPIRLGKKTADPALAEAIEGCSISLDREDPRVLILRKKLDSAVVGVLQNVLGDTPILTEEEQVVAASEAKFLAKLAETPEPEAAPVVRTNPYYTRER